jgi:hypothetical protein
VVLDQVGPLLFDGDCPLLEDRVVRAVDPTSTVGRETVALFQRDAAAAGAERAVLVTLGRYSESARLATPRTVDLIDGQKLCELVGEKEIGIRIVPQVREEWFDRFDARFDQPHTIPGGLPLLRSDQAWETTVENPDMALIDGTWFLVYSGGN